MGAVDRNDRDSADYSTSIRTNRYYLRIFCWALDRVIHCLYHVVCWMAIRGLGCRKIKRYLSKNEGRRDFQIDLAIGLMNHGLGLDWDGDEGVDQPTYMRRDKFVPCNCKVCFFCLQGVTGVVKGVDTKKRKAVFHYQCRGRKVTEGCTKERVRLTTKSGTIAGTCYCRMCVRKDKRNISFREKEKDAKQSRMGCNQCREPICKVCWAKGYDKHVHT